MFTAQANYPDLRKCINTCIQMNLQTGKLENPQEGDPTEGNMEITYVAMFQNGDIEKARKYIVENADPKSHEKIYSRCMKI